MSTKSTKEEVHGGADSVPEAQPGPSSFGQQHDKQLSV